MLYKQVTYTKRKINTILINLITLMGQTKQKIGKKKKEKLWLLKLGDKKISKKNKNIYVKQKPPNKHFVTGVGEKKANYIRNYKEKKLKN